MKMSPELEVKLNEILKSAAEQESAKLLEKSRKEFEKLAPFYECQNVYEALALREYMEGRHNEC